MPDWPSIRAQNGHASPFGAEYVQIGNEIWICYEAVRGSTGLDTIDKLIAWYIECLHAYIDAIHRVDPSAKINIDGVWGNNAHI